MVEYSVKARIGCAVNVGMSFSETVARLYKRSKVRQVPEIMDMLQSQAAISPQENRELGIVKKKRWRKYVALTARVKREKAIDWNVVFIGSPLYRKILKKYNYQIA